MTSSGGWEKNLVRLFLLSVPIGLLILAGCRPAPAEFNLQYACLHRGLPTCLAAEEFAARVADRTDGRVQIKITTLEPSIRTTGYGAGTMTEIVRWSRLFEQ